MTITTLGTAAHISPTVIRTVFSHFAAKLKKAKEDRHTEATDELLFDEAFNIVKSFIELATHDTVESLQKFANTNVPAPPWATALPTMVPMDSCDEAAELLKRYFGPQDLDVLVGGSKWWQLRGIAGVQGEWIAQTSDWKKARAMDKGKMGAPPPSSARRPKLNARHEKKRSFTSRMPSSKKGKGKRRGGAAAGATAAEAVTDEAQQRTASEPDSDSDAERSKEPPSSEELDRLSRVCLYIHGGGGYFGSMSTHRYQIVRFARKFGGRCFAPVYRKAPQYPWPCALQDCLAAYLFLIRPPPGAKHKAIDPSKLVIAGDSAGGGLALAVLTVLRDLDLPMPAGAVLISPWCDMTHSFPSILQNTATDIIPPYSFIHKPSTLWPVPGVALEDDEAAAEDGPGRKVPIGVDTDKDTHSRRRSFKKHSSSKRSSTPVARKSEDPGERPQWKNPREQAVKGSSGQRAAINGVPPPPRLLYSEPIEVQTEDPDKPNIQLRSQIQLYATNAQLTHPLCSPILQGSLGGLPPLYIIAGNAEVLRDEIIYLAHRAAHPQRYPLRADLMTKSQRARQNAERFDSQPTKVHLQIYDDMCHVLTLFAFTTQSRFAYRAVASFIKHVTGAPTNLKDPFPEVAEGDVGPEDASQADGSEVNGSVSALSSVGGFVATPEQSTSVSAQSSRQGTLSTFPPLAKGMTPIDTSVGGSNGAATRLHDENLTSSPIKTAASRESSQGEGAVPLSATSVKQQQPLAAAAAAAGGLSVDSTHASSSAASKAESIKEQKRRASSAGVSNTYAGQVPLTRPSFQSYMIRERVNVKGFLRPLEPESQLQALQMHPDDIGRIKEGPCSRYLTGQEIWSKKFEKTARKVEKKRAKTEASAQKLLELAATHGLLEPTPAPLVDADGPTAREGIWLGLGSLSPMELVNETPPPSALAGRRDTEEALALIRTALHVRAEQRGVRKSKLKIRTVPEQSNAEQPAQRTRYGLRLWNYLMIRGGRGKVADKKKTKRRGEVNYDGPADGVDGTTATTVAKRSGEEEREERGYVDNTRQTNVRRSMSERRRGEGQRSGWTTQDDDDDDERHHAEAVPATTA